MKINTKEFENKFKHTRIYIPLLNGGLLALLSLIIVVILYHNNILLFILLILITILFFQIKSMKKYKKYYFICCILGACAEIIAITMGVWNYTNPSFLSIPIWLIPLWGIASFYIQIMYNIRYE